ncbi:YbaK/aminoacyl-tRNA synthetase-associated domain [Striga hermonthica]|uniref:YbaK/aminoacyl-tRNA synthetase-associated domain n=1 Tax=Striga hermonthica TaxID=68872 RepID=A0A9N7RHA4_STRHE|nr:YbaK/aminoacyl-tRNA synthetase-associated domain [Striga hermonthica]
MGFTKEQLLARLQELQIGYSLYDHPVVLTVEAQAKYVGHLKGGLCKNLFLKDKKQRFYIVSALAETKVDLKVLSQRLGLGKGGLRMAPEEALAEILQVPLGCVTPFALVNDSARHVSLLLDQGLKCQESCLFHPMSNDMTIALNACDLDKFLISIGKTPAYVDLEANPTVGKDQPPDLATLVPSDAKVSADPVEKNHVPANNQPTGVKVAKAVKPSNDSTKEKPTDAVNLSISYADTDKFVDEILEKTKSIFLSEIKEDNISKLGVELKSIATIFKNTAYTEGFRAGIHRQPKRL